MTQLSSIHDIACSYSFLICSFLGILNNYVLALWQAVVILAPSRFKISVNAAYIV